MLFLTDYHLYRLHDALRVIGLTTGTIVSRIVDVRTGDTR